ncbi:Methylated-DNA--protein-cysteine methyltransferase [Corynebacterium kutscheri]|uniref:Methylated-DNA--protein-cysteine methyltransferase n=1 Tax=Corynebacterium kutscheri TaxID=35755 RepID=A0A0F6QYR2_9CORY|nr:MGMT family protein [Corynebacterium kutscheri]AKE40305.1 putative methylated DNA-protein cysteine methyltransferase [Corynebacterium kutscheri]VEH05474.1 Methylated-DNA--protein-cysteine methyltransferase [Corynebacterium kutscheri]VEH10698.1 Methylated-DNA--protein-cysteine methyltransferase [Corynebacterium kutscheri]VEH81364.1 Methylated-DNA--protein-cysteine methyltransferase [Corynebacterium kutscheri]
MTTQRAAKQKNGNLPVDVELTLELDDLTERVLALVDEVPHGTAVSYGYIAQQAGCSPRQVGRIMRTHGHLCPWWRVVRADGSCAVAEKARGYWDKENIAYLGNRVQQVIRSPQQ